MIPYKFSSFGGSGGGGGGPETDPVFTSWAQSYSANFQDTYNNVLTFSADWSNASTEVQTNSASWSASVQDAIGLTLNGNGSAITTGSKGSITIPYNATIVSVTLVSDTTGNVVVDIKKSTYSSFPTNSSIVASAKPTLSSAVKSFDNTLTGWTTDITAGDILEFVVDSVSGIEQLSLVLKVIKY